MKLRAEDEAVEMIAQRYRFLPHLFRWHGHCYEVEAVEGCWIVMGRWRATRHFRVQCPAGTFELRQDLSTGAWRLRGGKLRPERAFVLRRGRHRRASQDPGENRARVLRRRPLSELGRVLSGAMVACRIPRAHSARGG